MSKADRLVEIMARLRNPEGGCPWDLEQSFETIAPHTLEEAYEVEHAIRRGDMEGLCEELGDLLLHVVFHAQMAREAGHFDFDAVVESICDKLVRRHPHVFGSAVVDSAEEQTRVWEEEKARERARRERARGSELDPFEGIPVALPALTRAVKLEKRVIRQGGDEPGAQELHRRAEVALTRLGRRLTELEESGVAEAGRDVGELLAAAARLARRLGVDPEQALGDRNHAYEEAYRDRLRRQPAADLPGSAESEVEGRAPVEPVD